MKLVYLIYILIFIYAVSVESMNVLGRVIYFLTFIRLNLELINLPFNPLTANIFTVFGKFIREQNGVHKVAFVAELLDPLLDP